MSEQPGLKEGLMNKRLLIPLIVVGVMALASLACLDTNYYVVQPSAPVATSTPQEIVAVQEQGQFLIGALAMAAIIAVGGFIFLGKMGRNSRLYGAIYWLLLLGGTTSFAWGILSSPVDVLYVGVSVVAVILTAPWAYWGNKLF